jgi:tRNA(Ile)-lysidine synthase
MKSTIVIGPAYSVPLTPDQGPVDLPNGWRVQVTSDPVAGAVFEYEAVMDLGKVDLSTLTVRSQQPGDRIDPLGMDGRTKKLQDLFVNAKVSREHRGSWPVIVDATGPLWVPGLALAERLKVTDGTISLIHLYVSDGRQGDGMAFM